MRLFRTSAIFESLWSCGRGAGSGVVVFCLGAMLLSQFGCVSRLAPEVNAASPRAADSQRATHLLTPEGTDDLSRFDDDALKARADKQRADAEARTAATFRYAVDYQGDDLSSDAAYRKLLFDMKQSETELDRLTRELELRSERRTPRTPASPSLP